MTELRVYKTKNNFLFVQSKDYEVNDQFTPEDLKVEYRDVTNRHEWTGVTQDFIRVFKENPELIGWAFIDFKERFRLTNKWHFSMGMEELLIRKMPEDLEEIKAGKSLHEIIAAKSENGEHWDDSTQYPKEALERLSGYYEAIYKILTAQTFDCDKLKVKPLAV